MRRIDPVLFLDFDRTLFDTDKFFDWLGPDRFSRILALTSGTLASPDFSSYLYPDTLRFLASAKRTHRLVLLTYTVNIALQKKKVRESGVMSYFDDIIFSRGDGERSGKGKDAREYLLRIGDAGWEHTFVDDSSENISEVKELNPEIRCVRIDRVPGGGGSLSHGYLPPDLVISSLDELVSVL